MSVFTLIKELCSELIKESHGTENDLSRAKRIAFEVLLKSSKNECASFEKTSEDFQFCCFELMVNNKLDDAKRLEQFVDVLKDNLDHVVPISSLLINLKNIERANKNQVSLNCAC